MHPALFKIQAGYNHLATAKTVIDFRNHMAQLYFQVFYKDPNGFTVETNHPIAFESPDHLYPYGTKKNLKNTLFNMVFYKIAKQEGFNPPYKILDMGCAGGGRVKSFIKQGHHAIGLEGSDYCKKHKMWEWIIIPKSLFTCDITKRFQVYHNNQKAFFDLITAWEVMEHIQKKDLPMLFDNIKKHLDGFFICSIATTPDEHEGFVLHQTVRPIKWWDYLFKQEGFIQRDDLLEVVIPKVFGEVFSSSIRVYEYQQEETI